MLQKTKEIITCTHLSWWPVSIKLSSFKSEMKDEEFRLKVWTILPRFWAIKENVDGSFRVFIYFMIGET